MSTPTQDLENVQKAYHDAQFLVSGVLEINASSNELLKAVSFELVNEAANLSKKLKRILEALEAENKKPN